MPELLARASAPGKLFIAGEHAVLRAGEPAILIAVDRGIDVVVTESAGAGGSIHAPGFAAASATWRREADAVVVNDPAAAFRYLTAVMEVVEALRLERGCTRRDYTLEVYSRLDDDSGRKYGLGSSAAVTAAAVSALDILYGLELSPLQRFQLGYLATLRVAPSASGGDLAASTFGGWVGYRGADRTRLRVDPAVGLDAFFTDDVWAGLEISALPASGLTLAVGWTGTPASTAAMVDRMRAHRETPAFSRFVEDSRATVTELGRALNAHDTTGTLTTVRRARVLLRELGAAAGVVLETPALAALADAADALGGAGKPSGAGGGDCGIALLPTAVETLTLEGLWHDAGVVPLALEAHAEGAHVG